jgi:hypothetical protein
MWPGGRRESRGEIAETTVPYNVASHKNKSPFSCRTESWAGGPAFQSRTQTIKMGAPLFAHFAKGGNDAACSAGFDLLENLIAHHRTGPCNKGRSGGLARLCPRCCHKAEPLHRKVGAADGLMVSGKGGLAASNRPLSGRMLQNLRQRAHPHGVRRSLRCPRTRFQR